MPEFWTTLGAIFLFVEARIPAVAAVIGIGVAIAGLSTWRHQLYGSSEYELARRLLTSTYALRDAFKHVRDPMMLVHEMPYPSEDRAKKMSEEEIRYYGRAKGYEARWDKVLAVRQKLDPDLLEAEALWVNEMKNRIQPLNDLQQELVGSINNNLALEDPATLEGVKSAIIDKGNYFETIYSMGEDDKFSNRVYDAVVDIENFLRPKLKKN